MNPDVVVKVAEQSHTWWDLAPAIIGGVIGALAGGIPAFLLARRASQEAAEQRKRELLQADRAKAIRVFGVLQAIVNSFFSTRLMLDEMLEAPVDPTEPFPIQKRVRAIAGFAGETKFAFNTDDLSIFIAFDRSDYFQTLDLLARRHATIMSALEEYRRERARLYETLREAKHEIGQNGQVTSAMDEALFMKVRLQEAVLESIIAPVVEMFRENTPKLIDAAEEFGPIIKDHLKGSGIVPALDLGELKARYASKSA